MQKNLSMDALRSGVKETHTYTVTREVASEESQATEVERSWGERLSCFAECMEWLERKRRKYGIHPKSVEFAEVMEAMAEHRDHLNEQWSDGSDEEFKESLRRYMRACAQEMLRTYKGQPAARYADAEAGTGASTGHEQISLEDA